VSFRTQNPWADWMPAPNVIAKAKAVVRMNRGWTGQIMVCFPEFFGRT
jgi:hypothetical protein